MEILMALGIFLVILLMIGHFFLPFIYIFIGLLGLFAAFCAMFFLVTALIAVAARPRDAVFAGLDKDEKGISFAYYEIDQKEYRNAFPTDAFLNKILYHKTDVRIRFLQISDVTVLFDKVTLWIIGIGLPVFGFIAFVLFELMQLA